MNLTPTQKKVLDVVKQKVKVSCSVVSQTLNITNKAAGLYLRRLQEMGFVHVAERDTSKPRMPVNIYACGAGHDEKKKASQLKQDAARKAFTKRNTYDPEAPVMPNNGWVSTIHSWDRSVSHLDHVEFMARFQPHPDQASVWLFNKPKVELQGAKHDLV